MSSKIRVLDEQTINKIAAGEVIENPASVVKELVENSIDAGSTNICVEIKGGGRQLIRITDDGCGMNGDDALLCLERHATSKIRDVEDIHSIYTMGFRGEAVPSIASISKFNLMTCPVHSNKSESDSKGTMVVVDGGKIVQCCPIARSQGTTIEVKSLFFNVPVRKKFQKSPAYDANEILKVLSNIALGHPSIKFELICDQKNVLVTRPDSNEQNSLKKRVEEILGAEFCSATCPIEAQKGEYFLKGLIGVPGYTRHNRTGQHLFINKRAVLSPLVSFAVRDGYGTALPQNRHPVYVLHLTIPGMLVDVNVHPQKREVRLRQEQALKEMIMEAVRNGLQHASPLSFETVDLPQANFMDEPAQTFMPASNKDYASFAVGNEPSTFQKPFNATRDSFREMPALAPLPSLPERKMPFQPIPSTVSELFATPPSKSPKVLAALKQYLLIDSSGLREHGEKHNGEVLCLVDQRAAHSRIIFERLSTQAQKLSSERLPLQALLIPYTFETTPLESALLVQYVERLNALGISLRQSGPNVFLIDAIPQIFGNSDLRALVTGIVNAMRDNSGSDILQQEQEKQIAAIASRAAVSQQRSLTSDEAQALMDQLMKCQSPFQCPMGKPTMISITYEELSKRFQK